MYPNHNIFGSPKFLTRAFSMPSKKHGGTHFFNSPQLDAKLDSPMPNICIIPNNLQAIEHTSVEEDGVAKFNMDDYLVVDEIDNANQTTSTLAFTLVELEFTTTMEHLIITPSSLTLKLCMLNLLSNHQL
jgi:hypothetical protein